MDNESIVKIVLAVIGVLGGTTFIGYRVAVKNNSMNGIFNLRKNKNTTINMRDIFSNVEKVKVANGDKKSDSK